MVVSFECSSIVFGYYSWQLSCTSVDYVFETGPDCHNSQSDLYIGSPILRSFPFVWADHQYVLLRYCQIVLCSRVSWLIYNFSQYSSPAIDRTYTHRNRNFPVPRTRHLNTQVLTDPVLPRNFLLRGQMGISHPSAQIRQNKDPVSLRRQWSPPSLGSIPSLVIPWKRKDIPCWCRARKTCVSLFGEHRV